MKRLVTSRQMKECDSYTISHYGVPSLVLMERASLAVVDEIKKENMDLRNILVVCGSGNNGGDGVAVARLLYLAGNKVSIFFAGDMNRCSEETKQQLLIARNYKVPIVEELELQKYTLIIDAILGISIRHSVEGKLKKIVEMLNQSDIPIVSIDVPTGICSDTGEIMGIAVNAYMTVTFAFQKVGLCLYPGAKCAGKVKVCDIGIVFDGVHSNNGTYHALEKKDLALLPTRPSYSNKGTFGKILIIAGSVNMSGASYFSAKAAYKTGAGLVKIVAPKENRIILQSALPEAMLMTYAANQAAQIKEGLSAAFLWADVIVIGPGLGLSEDARQLLWYTFENVRKPFIIDADGLNIISENLSLLEMRRKYPLIITPHIGEMSRLTMQSISNIQKNKISAANEFARKYNVICILKDARTIVTDGQQAVYINCSGNNAMATGGSGDILTGILASLLHTATPDTRLLSCALAVYIHGLAGEKASKELGYHSVMSSDIIENIHSVLKEQNE